VIINTGETFKIVDLNPNKPVLRSGYVLFWVTPQYLFRAKTIKLINMLNTFDPGGKKIDERELEGMYQKNKAVSFHYTNREIGLVNMIHLPEKKKRTRLVVKRGLENISMMLDNVVLFYAENKFVYTIDDTGNKYIVERSLSELIYELDNSIFFRANRQYIINIKHVKSFKVYEKVKLKVDLKPDEVNAQHCVIISQETAPAFKKWIYEV